MNPKGVLKRQEICNSGAVIILKIIKLAVPSNPKVQLNSY